MFQHVYMLCFFHTLAVRDKEQSEKLDTYQRMIGARDVEINAISSRLSTVQKQNKELESKLKEEQNQKSDYKQECERLRKALERIHEIEISQLKEGNFIH